ncbi:MAG: hypothetical protein ACKOAZ_04880 [Ilumatobacteraceae bacterium]
MRTSALVAFDEVTSVQPLATGSPVDAGHTSASARPQIAYTGGVPSADTSRTSTDFHGPPATPSTTRLPSRLTTAVCAPSSRCSRTVIEVSSATVLAVVPP